MVHSCSAAGAVLVVERNLIIRSKACGFVDDGNIPEMLLYGNVIIFPTPDINTSVVGIVGVIDLHIAACAVLDLIHGNTVDRAKPSQAGICCGCPAFVDINVIAVCLTG